jgi:cob(I)alamin adenosyltransferase
MKAEQIKEQIENIDQQLFELDETLSCNDEIDVHRYYELEAKLITQKKLLLTDYENLIAL